MANIKIGISFGKVALSQGEYNMVIKEWDEYIEEAKNKKKECIIRTAKEAIEKSWGKKEKNRVFPLNTVRDLLSVAENNIYVCEDNDREKEWFISRKIEEMLESGKIKITK